jgi:alanyl-tRNA synthetase
MDPHTIRAKYLSFFEARGHREIPSARLVPENDPTTLFTGSGMQPLLPYLLGEAHPQGTRLVDSQKCFRSGDIEEVGDNRHTTFFEMLGNWSLGEYGKREQLPWFFELLTKDLGLDPKRIYVTVFAGAPELGIAKDTEAVEIWKGLFAEMGIDAVEAHLGSEEEGARRGIRAGERIFFYDAKKNWWSRAGVPSAMPVGEPGGPDSEVFYEFDVEHDPTFGEHCHPNCDCGRFLEIGNSVFMQYRKEADGSFSLLPKPNVDFGGGLERIAMAVNDTPDIITVNHRPIVDYIEKSTGKTYGADSQETKAFRVIADHMKAAVFLIADGVLPSNTDQGYFVRRLIRRAVRYADLLGIHESGLSSVVPAIAASYAAQYPALSAQIAGIQQGIDEEERRFRTSLARGMRKFDDMVYKSTGIVDLKLTNGTQLTELLETAPLHVLPGEEVFKLITTDGFPRELIEEIATERGLTIDWSDVEERIKEHRELSRAGSEQKFKGGLADASEKTTMLHTCTHLMLAGLRKYLGEGVHQAGSNITSERARFDFTYHEKVSREVLDKVEAYVNEAITSGAHMTTAIVAKEVARAEGVEGSFWEKYPSEVTVYTFASPEGVMYSQELCGGPHVKSASDIQGVFKILKEEASSAGVRRIKATLV